jgi:large subunit ribosomal protein L3
MNGLIGKKVGMTSIFDNAGKNIACTVVEVAPNVVTQVKDSDTDGYSALQLGAFDAKEKNVSKAMKGHFAVAKTNAKKKIVEFRNSNLVKSLGDSITIEEVFAEGDKVQAIGVSKGKGFQGVVKRHGFKGVGDATHGQHNRLRAPGSVGASSYPSRVFKGMRMGGRMGNDRVTVKGLRIVKMLPEKNLLIIKGAIPGHKGAFVIIEK